MWTVRLGWVEQAPNRLRLMAGSESPVRHPLFARLLEWNAARDEERGQAELRDELLRGLQGAGGRGRHRHQLPSLSGNGA